MSETAEQPSKKEEPSILQTELPPEVMIKVANAMISASGMRYAVQAVAKHQKQIKEAEKKAEARAASAGVKWEDRYYYAGSAGYAMKHKGAYIPLNGN
jgi:hypothetical protein